jgi:hypothetical protein
VERLKPVVAALLALFFAYGVLKVVGWILGFTIEFVLNFAFLVLLLVVAVPIYWILRGTVFRSRTP